MNVDDATGETLAHAVAALLDAGAHDAWVTPIVMKKGRPAHTVSALCDPALAGQIAATLRAETVRSACAVRRSSGGLRRVVKTRSKWRDRSIRVKVSPGRVKVEHDDAVRAGRALAHAASRGDVAAEEAWRREAHSHLTSVPPPDDDAG